MNSRAPTTARLASFVSQLRPDDIPAAVMAHARAVVFDGIGVLAAASHSKVTSAAGMGAFAEAHGGTGPATLVGRGRRTDIVNAVLANGTLGYAADFEPHHPEAILHPVAVTLPTALALAEARGRSGAEALAAIVAGCEITYRVSMALDPRALYDQGFHPSAVAGTFGAAATAAMLLGLDAAQCVRAFGLAGLQTSGLLAWQDDEREDARPFQMGMAARNGVTAGLLAEQGFGAPDRIFDGGHTVLKAYGRQPDTAALTEGLGETWEGMAGLAIKPYPCVSFLHPALDALVALLDRERLAPSDIAGIDLRFANAGAHCVDDNPLKGHCAQYILPVRAARGRLSFLDLFSDLRLDDPQVARLAAATTVTRDHAEFDAAFPDFYVGEVTLRLADGRALKERRDIARGYREAALSHEELEEKFDDVVTTVADDRRRRALKDAAWGLAKAPDVGELADLLAERSTF